MKKPLFLVYGIFCYVVSLATIGYAALYFGNICVPHTIDMFGAMRTEHALAVNAALIFGFALQHSGMARNSLKRLLARVVSNCMVRSTYILMSSLAIIALMVFWQPIGILVWSVESSFYGVLIAAVYFGGWVLILWSTCLVDHLEMFGLRQAWTASRGGTCAEPDFQAPGAYRHIRHPIHVGWIIVLWATPVMTVTHLLLAVGMTMYIVAGTALEEVDLRNRYRDYAQYMRKVPKFIPSLRRRLDTPGSDPFSRKGL
jgi:protein-S-isoprenylcysteine O-methyltransferase Ste14